jgi:hypothetical protein
LSNKLQFFLWELVAVFFIMTYDLILNLVSVSGPVETAIIYIIKLFWILMALISLLIGLVSMRR